MNLRLRGDLFPVKRIFWQKNLINLKNLAKMIKYGLDPNSTRIIRNSSVMLKVVGKINLK